MVRRMIDGMKIHYPTNDPDVLRGYVVGRAWPDKSKGRKSHGPNPYLIRNEDGSVEGGHGADGFNAQDSEGSYSESGQAATE